MRSVWVVQETLQSTTSWQNCWIHLDFRHDLDHGNLEELSVPTPDSTLDCLKLPGDQWSHWGPNWGFSCKKSQCRRCQMSCLFRCNHGEDFASRDTPLGQQLKEQSRPENHIESRYGDAGSRPEHQRNQTERWEAILSYTSLRLMMPKEIIPTKQASAMIT